MKYQFKVDIDEKEYDKFVRNFPSTSFMQTPAWSKVKTAWGHSYVGLYENDKLIWGAMILKRNLFLGKKLFYVPRGFVAYYSDKKVLTKFIDEIKRYAKENGAIDIKIDPFICFNEDNIQNIKKNKGIEIRKSYTNNTEEIVKELKKLGFVHGGYKKEVNAYIQPRYTMVISLKDN